MRFLLSFFLAGLVSRLNLTVTALLQHPLQRLRALAPSGDQPPRSTPPTLNNR